MKGSMMDYPLTLQAILERIPKTYPNVEIVSRLADGGLQRYTYLDFYRRTKALAEALHRAGLQPGDRVAHALLEPLLLIWKLTLGCQAPAAWCTR